MANQLPNTVERFTEPNVEIPKEDEQKFTPESVTEDESLKTQLPTPTGYRIMILPFSRKQKTKGGIIFSRFNIRKRTYWY